MRPTASARISKLRSSHTHPPIEILVRGSKLRSSHTHPPILVRGSVSARTTPCATAVEARTSGGWTQPAPPGPRTQVQARQRESKCHFDPTLTQKVPRSQSAALSPAAMHMQGVKVPLGSHSATLTPYTCIASGLRGPRLRDGATRIENELAAPPPITLSSPFPR